jgi:transposase
VTHPLGCHRQRIADRIVFEKVLQVLRFGCSYQAIADSSCSATTIRARRDEWIEAGIFARLRQIALEAYDRIVGLVLEEITVDGCITKAPRGGECAGRSPVDRGKQGMKRSLMVTGTASRSIACWPRRAGMTPRCWASRRTSSTGSARCPMTSASTSTPGTTPRSPAMSSPAGG